MVARAVGWKVARAVGWKVARAVGWKVARAVRWKVARAVRWKGCAGGDPAQDFALVTAWTTSWSGGHRPCTLGLASRMLGL
jgi:hypothetical protein